MFGTRTPMILVYGSNGWFSVDCAYWGISEQAQDGMNSRIHVCRVANRGKVSSSRSSLWSNIFKRVQDAFDT
ncbi:hypothetical protein BV25DRAFT_90734 [Artomyces pyxidatus]|uniref:Uncharacterized protein n=1 Tax=Artomyces pyxidatus TaxID=48021 RepID=A0ACB8TKT5_9AGAM|nr:hypothetical protein BV25DRAFT_90734 [Artomyces pyxidatus]